MNKRSIRIGAFIFLCIYTGIIIYITLLSREPTADRQYNFQLFWSYLKFFDETDPQARQILLNILLFIPFGILLAVVDGADNWKSTLLLVLLSATVLSGLIEGLQLIYKLGLAELDDVFDNTVGAVVGMTVMVGVDKLIRRCVHVR